MYSTYIEYLFITKILQKIKLSRDTIPFKRRLDISNFFNIGNEPGLFLTSSSAASTLSSRTSGVSSGTASGSSQDSSPAEACRQRKFPTGEAACRQRKFPTLGRPHPPPPTSTAARLSRAQSFSTVLLPARGFQGPASAGVDITTSVAAYRQEPHPSKFLLTSTPLSTSRLQQADRQLLKPARIPATGRQPSPLYSVLYGIISKRRSVLAAQLLLREKSGA
jgi:hypothetical protein